MKTQLLALLLCLSVLSAPLNALAHDPTITFTFIGGVPVVPGEDTPVTVPYFPYTIDFEGFITHEGEGNLNVIELSATVNDELIYGPELFKGAGNETSAPFLIPWVVEAPGQYEVAVIGTHKTPDNKTNCKAAPAIAAAYLKNHEANDTKGSVISAVAKETGKDGLFFAKDKCVVGYETRVITFVEGSPE